jgi:hypothetical protein
LGNFVEGIIYNQTLKILHIDRKIYIILENNLGDSSCKDIKKILLYNSTLIDLGIAGNNVLYKKRMLINR